ncbi:hypothetical protein [Curtobacterium sp. ME12]|uniref:hypothetical protein n=1 Tax=Curtobacterium sp. ME12 TaxID=2744253 RepID=UPI0015F678A0|nr:hypothetical protein [Curtobacterium sp. ME12]
MTARNQHRHRSAPADHDALTRTGYSLGVLLQRRRRTWITIAALTVTAAITAVLFRRQ